MTTHLRRTAQLPLSFSRLTMWTIAVVLLLARRRHARDLAKGLLVGYAVWFLYFMLWFLQGPEAPQID